LQPFQGKKIEQSTPGNGQGRHQSQGVNEQENKSLGKGDRVLDHIIDNGQDCRDTRLIGQSQDHSHGKGPSEVREFSPDHRYAKDPEEIKRIKEENNPADLQEDRLVVKDKGGKRSGGGAQGAIHKGKTKEAGGQYDHGFLELVQDPAFADFEKGRCRKIGEEKGGNLHETHEPDGIKIVEASKEGAGKGHYFTSRLLIPHSSDI